MFLAALSAWRHLAPPSNNRRVMRQSTSATDVAEQKRRKRHLLPLFGALVVNQHTIVERPAKRWTGCMMVWRLGL